MTQPQQPSVAATGEATVSGGDAAVTIFGSGVESVTVRDLWTEWEVSAVDADGAAFDTNLPEGRCEFQWDSVQESVAPVLGTSIPEQYISGDYYLSVVGANASTRAETTAMVSIDDPETAFETTPVVEGLEDPWGFQFLPNGSELLVTERDTGRLVLAALSDGATQTVAGTPDVYSVGQGGLLDITLDPDFPDRPWVYLTYSAADDGGEATHVGRGLFEPAGPRLREFEPLHVAEPFVHSGQHFGSRVAFGEDGKLYVTTGDRRDMEFDDPDEHVSQDKTNELGCTLRLNPDGTIPEDNPFVEEADAADAIFSYGHRNPQGLAVHPETGALWQSEHGERDGDEINIVEAGDNHGWPAATYACEYGTMEPIGDDPHERADIEDPVYFWECGTGGFPPSNATFYGGDAFPDWQGDLFVGNLAGQYLGRFVVEGRQAVEAEPLLADRGWRIRDVREHPETGHLYLAVDADPAPIVSLSPG